MVVGRVGGWPVVVEGLILAVGPLSFSSRTTRSENNAHCTGSGSELKFKYYEMIDPILLSLIIC